MVFSWEGGVFDAVVGNAGRQTMALMSV